MTAIQLQAVQMFDVRRDVLGIGPHPELSVMQQKIIAVDYGMHNAGARSVCR